MGSVICVEHLRMNYQSPSGETRAIDDLSFDVEEGAFVSIVGPSGCGKSTLLSVLCGLLAPSAGNVSVFGQPIAPETAREIGYMLQKDHLFEWRTILGNVLLGLEIQGKKTPETVAHAVRLLQTYGLGEFLHAHPSALSGGMRQRAALIRTLAVQPKILLLDEPFSALDYQTRLTVADDIRAILRKEQKTAVLVTHDISEAISLSDRVLVLGKRPATLKGAHDITFDLEERTSLAARSMPEFRSHFNQIWKEMQEDA